MKCLDDAIDAHCSVFAQRAAPPLTVGTNHEDNNTVSAKVDGELDGKAAVLMWPVKPLNFAPLARLFGSQLFAIRKNSQSPGRTYEKGHCGRADPSAS
jgi:hypothetical protein